MPHVHKFTDLSGAQRVADDAIDCDSCSPIPRRRRDGSPAQARELFRSQFDHEPKLARQVCAFPERAGHICGLERRP